VLDGLQIGLFAKDKGLSGVSAGSGPVDVLRDGKQGVAARLPDILPRAAAHDWRSSSPV